MTGGTGSDLYIIQSNGGKAIIDNFAEDNVRDIIVINVDYASIRCYQTGVDLHLSYSKSHHIRIKNWFVSGDPTYYRHVSFQSQDGVVFVPKQILNNQDIHVVQCVAVALDLGAAKKTQTATLNDYRYRQVKQVSGSNSSDNIFGNDVNNILDEVLEQITCMEGEMKTLTLLEQMKDALLLIMMQMITRTPLTSQYSKYPLR